MSSPSYRTTVKASGTPTAFVDAATTRVSGNVFKISDFSKSCFDLNTAVTVYDDGVPLSAEEISSIDYLFGIVELVADPAGDVTIDGAYVPLAFAAGAKEYELSIQGDILDDTDFENASNNGGFMTRCYGILDVSASIGRNDKMENFFKELKTSRTPVLLEFRPGLSSTYARGWFVVESVSTSGDVGSLETESVAFNLAGKDERNFSIREI